MSLFSHFRGPIRALVAITLALVFALSSTILAFASVTLLQLSSDPFTNSTSQHKTEVEPDTFAAGSTLVSVFQVGASSVAALPISVSPPPPIEVRALPMASCLVPLQPQHRRASMRLSVMPPWPLTPGMGSG